MEFTDIQELFRLLRKGIPIQIPVAVRQEARQEVQQQRLQPSIILLVHLLIQA